MLNYNRYQKNPVVDFPERTWPNKEIKRAPIWCSVDLRDGNQALIEPMVVEEKIEFFQMLIKLGFKEIEVGFPSASQIEFDFLRQLIDRNLIPDDVVVQVLTQCRDHLLERTFEAIQGLKKVIVHIYNSTSTLQRDVVFGMTKNDIKEIALNAAKMVKRYQEEFSGEIILEYSPESFTGTELDYALEVCNEVEQIWKPTRYNKLIINLPATVEMNTPNVYADQIEWVSNHLNHRENIILSVHPHNDRGTGVAIAELALLAGAERVEGTLFGNGERTGNVDILTLSYNMFSQGVNPKLDIENIVEIKEIYERLCKLIVPERHPYAGKLVFTAFSGSHQDAINKGIHVMNERKSKIWQVPYLPIDPADIGRDYEPIVRINSQSGKGGVAFIMETYHGFRLPKGMHKEFADIIQKIAEVKGEIGPDLIMLEFKHNYLDQKEPLHFIKCRLEDASDSDDTKAELTFSDAGIKKTVECHGNGPIDAVKAGLEKEVGRVFRILDYFEHSLGEGSNAQAAAYVQILDVVNGRSLFGVGISSNITRASIRAVFSAVNRML